ncbi:uncharacterized protein TNCV_3743881 [Trichonephila clavipes]|nr:uncharacterized protein TNCV_3743881 [Trichonephila clavipes]
MMVTVRFGSAQPQLRGRTPWGSQVPPTSLPIPLTSREDLWLEGYLEEPHAAKALFIYKHSCLLQDLNPGPTARLSTSLTTIPDEWLE